MTKNLGRTAKITRADEAAIPVVVPDTDTMRFDVLKRAASLGRFEDESLGWVYLAWLDQERLNVAHALGAWKDGMITVPVVDGLYELFECSAYIAMEQRALINLTLLHADELGVRHDQ